MEGRDLSSIIRSIHMVAERFLDPTDPLRRTAEEALPVITGASLPMVRKVLDGMAVDWTREKLEALVRAEFSDPAVLERFRPRPGLPGHQSRAIGPRLVTHIFSGNVPGVAATSLIRALLVRAPSLGKTAAGEPLLPALFARGIAEADAELGRCLAVTYWPGGEGEMENVALERAEAVIVYGGNDAVRAVRARVGAGVRFLGYGHRISFGVIARECLDASSAMELAHRAALDVATFDQQGCVSPHLFYAEEGGRITPEEWAAMLAIAFERVEVELPRGRLAPSEASAIRQLRGEMEFAQLAGKGVALHASASGTAWTVIYDPDPRFTASCLNRTVRVKPVHSLDAVAHLVAPVGGIIQSIGVAATEQRALGISEQLAAVGASRITRIGQMAWPEPFWLHDGRPPLADLVRWCDRVTALMEASEPTEGLEAGSPAPSAVE
ncbi:acyl-CoA reductase [soil metagenome]